MSATRKAVLVVTLCMVAQLALWIGSIFHPLLNDWLTAFFALTIAIYPMIFAYHAKKTRSHTEHLIKSRTP